MSIRASSCKFQTTLRGLHVQVFHSLYQNIVFKLRNALPLRILGLATHVELPDNETLQIVFTATCVSTLSRPLSDLRSGSSSDDEVQPQPWRVAVCGGCPAFGFLYRSMRRTVAYLVLSHCQLEPRWANTWASARDL
jgi:hypothetical protein